MAYILVTADFPNITSEKRDEIYECLKTKKWNKVTEPSRDISTTWYASFEEGITENEAIQITKREFDNCSSPKKPKLAIHWGPNKPTFHNLL